MKHFSTFELPLLVFLAPRLDCVFLISTVSNHQRYLSLETKDLFKNPLFQTAWWSLNNVEGLPFRKHKMLLSCIMASLGSSVFGARPL